MGSPASPSAGVCWGSAREVSRTGEEGGSGLQAFEGGNEQSPAPNVGRGGAAGLIDTCTDESIGAVLLYYN